MALGAGSSAVLSRAGRSRPRRYDAVHSGPDVLRVGHRPDATAGRHRLLAAAPQQRHDPADRHLSDGRRRVCVRHSRRRLDGRTDHPHAGHHHDAGGRTRGGRPLCRYGLHRRDDDLRRLAGVRRTAQPDHEGESISASWATRSFLSTARQPRLPPISSSPGSYAASSAASVSTSRTWTSSTPTPPTCAFCRRRVTAKCITAVELVEAHAGPDDRVGRIGSSRGFAAASRSAWR